MSAVSKRIKIYCLFGLLTAIAFSGTVYSGEPLKVFILAGQSNMEGHGEMYGTSPGHLEQMVIDNPATYGHLKDGANWAVREDVWIWYLRLNQTVPKKGNLTAGYGAYNTTIGPELQFGNVMGDFYDAPVFILKCAWGGKSLAFDFRPPSSGWLIAPSAPGDKGYYYQLTVDTINDFKADPSSFCDGFNPADGYEIVGFGWHQGWNDGGTTVEDYAFNMSNFIKDIRSELGKPNLPFSISTTGMASGDTYSTVELAQLEMANFAKYPDFEGDVTVDDTTSYQRPYKITVGEEEIQISPSDQGHHWNRNAESYYLIGTGMGNGIVDMLVDPNAPEVDAGSDMITWSGKAVVMDPNVAETPGSDWTNLTYIWTATPSEGVTFDPSPNVKNPAVTITADTGNPSTVVMKLEVNNSGRTEHGVINTMQIDVYEDACKAALGKGLATYNLTDINGDCVTTIADFAAFAAEWLNNGFAQNPIKK